MKNQRSGSVTMLICPVQSTHPLSVYWYPRVRADVETATRNPQRCVEERIKRTLWALRESRNWLLGGPWISRNFLPGPDYMSMYTFLLWGTFIQLLKGVIKQNTRLRIPANNLPNVAMKTDDSQENNDFLLPQCKLFLNLTVWVPDPGTVVVSKLPVFWKDGQLIQNLWANGINF